MANKRYFTPNGGSQQTLWDSTVATNQSILQPGQSTGLGNPPGEPQFERTPELYADRYRLVTYQPRVISERYLLLPSTQTAAGLAALRANWDGWHNKRLGEGVLEILSESGATFCIDCVPLDPEYANEAGFTVEVTQQYKAGLAFFRSKTATTVNGTFNGSTPVNVSCVVAGDIPAWFVATVTGIVDTPRITNAAGDYIETTKVTTNADDTIVFDTRPGHFGIWYYEHGTGEGVACPRTFGSKRLMLPIGTYNAVLSADSGTPTVAIVYYAYYEKVS